MRHSWTKEEVAFIKENRSTMTIQQMANILKLDRSQVKEKLSNLKIRIIPPSLTQNMIDDILECKNIEDCIHVAEKYSITINRVMNFRYYKKIKTFRLYSIWEGMINRCYSKSNTKYKDYGFRGITISNEWKNDFINFYKWAIVNGYQSHLTIDRIDVNGNYCPENCRWATNLEQSHNKRNNRKITAWGETKLLCEWENDHRSVGSQQQIWARLKLGWSAEDAISKPINKSRKSDNHFLTVFGETKTVAEWSRDARCVVSLGTLSARVRRGVMSHEDCIITQCGIIRKTGTLLAAFGEIKTLVDWSNDERCLISYSSLLERYHANKLTPEEMISNPPKRKLKCTQQN